MRTLNIVEVELVAGGTRRSMGAHPVTASIKHGKAHHAGAHHAGSHGAHHGKSALGTSHASVHEAAHPDTLPIHEGGGGGGDGEGDGGDGDGDGGGDGDGDGDGGSDGGDGDGDGGGDEGPQPDPPSGTDMLGDQVFEVLANILDYATESEVGTIAATGVSLANVSAATLNANAVGGQESFNMFAATGFSPNPDTAYVNTPINWNNVDWSLFATSGMTYGQALKAMAAYYGPGGKGAK